ncbi:C45 family autoproteolytic acyltransferase/hydolase [Breznakiella homolactica]|uniref:Linear amide C-N hydrolase n=1 Tax=Breznakiella homolactica TaxID=2798577 RepID=A0A7T7XK39_9SPIR|nr:C45 family peptidase [Breznakiella homolactica]QQO07841.1 C45 family peptidase [Breznakiella homolactica]
MITIQARTMELSGTSYEIGFRLGKMAGAIPPLKKLHTGGMAGFGKEQAAEAAALFKRWCPGLEEELTGFADALAVPPEQIFYYGMTYLLPRCSQIGVLPGAAAEGRPLVARNYEFSHEAEDFCLVKTSVTGKHTHMGTSVIFFGRDDGFNEHGLSVTMTSCGFPVGPMPYMRPPKITGLQFWAVIRSVLENCKDVEEGLDHLEGMPIAFNVNLMLVDKAGNLALVETLDGKTAVKRLGPGSPEQLFWTTNHAVLPELRALEPQALVHSLRRYEWIGKELKDAGGITRDRLKEILLSKYPDGLSCRFFEEYFGTTKSMVISPAEGTIDLCWGGRIENGWNTYDIREPLAESVRPIEIDPVKADPAEYQFKPL